MDLESIMTHINWKTTGLAMAYGVCKIVGSLYSPAASVCEVLDTVIVVGGFASAADAGRVQNVVKAVDAILWKTKIDPETIASIEPLTPAVEVK